VQRREAGWIFGHYVAPIRPWVRKLLAALRQRIAYLFALAYLHMHVLYVRGRKYTQYLVGVERRRRIRDFKRSEAYTRQQVKLALQTVQREAASGYRTGFRDRLSLIARLAELAGVRNPVVSGLVKTVVTGIIDLIGVENPVARIALGFIIKRIIGKIGIDAPIGQLIDRLAAPLLGNPKPRNLHDVIMDLSGRIGSVEQQWAQFMEDGGPELLQAGREWKGITSVLGNVALLAFTAQLATDPDAWAREVAGALGDPVNAVMSGMADLIGKA
jgi:hypothetical protein